MSDALKTALFTIVRATEDEEGIALTERDLRIIIGALSAMVYGTSMVPNWPADIERAENLHRAFSALVEGHIHSHIQTKPWPMRCASITCGAPYMRTLTYNSVLCPECLAACQARNE